MEGFGSVVGSKACDLLLIGKRQDLTLLRESYRGNGISLRGIAMNNQIQKFGFIASGLMNLGGVLILSKFFSNSVINQADPVVMSNFGLLMICVWGLVFLGCATLEGNIKWLAAAFAVEKLVYVTSWVSWQMSNSLSSVYQQDLFAGVFFTIYGVNDFIFMLFFVWLFKRHSETK